MMQARDPDSAAEHHRASSNGRNLLRFSFVHQRAQRDGVVSRLVQHGSSSPLFGTVKVLQFEAVRCKRPICGTHFCCPCYFSYKIRVLLFAGYLFAGTLINFAAAALLR
jgi:hypothetical protein